MSTEIVLLDRVLAHYGPETKDVRDLLHGAVARTLDLLSPQDRAPGTPSYRERLREPLCREQRPEVAHRGCFPEIPNPVHGRGSWDNGHPGPHTLVPEPPPLSQL